MEEESKSKIICEPPLDRISLLPDDIMSQILESLPLREAAKSGILSKKWLHSWLSLPQLRFDADFFSVVLRNKQFPDSEFNNILSLVLLSHIGPINKLYLSIPEFRSSMGVVLGPMLSFLSRNNIKEIVLENGQKLPIKLPSYFFSCLQLEKLRLSHFSIELLPCFKGFHNLSSLELENIVIVENSLKGLIAGCPSLESLTLRNFTGYASVYINAPNLKYLTLSGNFECISFKGEPKLVAVSITVGNNFKAFDKSRRHELIEFLANSSTIENIFFGGYFCKVLAAGGSRGLLKANYQCLKVLALSNIETNDLDEFCCVIGLIQSCPNVEELQISFASKSSADNILVYDPGFVLAHLRKAHISEVTGVSMELKLIEFLLLCSPALESLYVERSKQISSLLESRMTRELMCFTRASPKAKVIYLDPSKAEGCRELGS